MKVRSLISFAPMLFLAACGSKTMETQARPESLESEIGANGLQSAPDSLAVAGTGPLYGRALTEADITKTFGLAANQSVTRAVFENFLKTKLKIAAADATQAAKAFLVVGSAAFIPDAQKQQDLAQEGLSNTNIADGLSPREYLMYLRVAHGDGRCPNAKAGSANCPAYVRDFQMSLITNQNGIFNVRFSGPDSQYDNKLTVHRESQANRQLFGYIGATLRLGGHPLKGIVMDPGNAAQCSELESMLGSSAALEKFLAQTVNVNPQVAAVTARQWAATVSEVTNGVTYAFGFASFLQGKVCSRDTLGKCYAADPNMSARLVQLVPGFATKTSFNCSEIAKVVNTLTSMPAIEPIDFSKPLALPYDKSSPSFTADELFDFFIALGNGLTNRPNAQFADILPLADLQLLNSSGIDNPEYQMTSQVNRYFMQRFVGR
jgi:hypothetical protein